MKDGKIKERYEVSLDSRQFGLAIFGAAALAALVFVLGVSVGLQWEKKKAAEAKAMAPEPPVPAAAVPAVPPAPVAPPVYAPVTTAAAEPPAPQPDGGKKEEKKPQAAKAGREEKKLDDLTFPKVLTSNNKNTAPLTPEKKKPAEGRYFVQVAAFNEEAAAKAKAEKLEKKGYDAHVFVADKKGSYRYKVRVGSYASKDQAAEAAKKLKAGEKVSPYIVKE